MGKLSGLPTETTFSLTDLLLKIKAGGTGDVQVTFANLITALLGSGAFGTAVTSYSNAGTAGGTFYYINLGGIKLLWGQTANVIGSSTPGQYIVNTPVGFFTTVQAGFTTVNGTITTNNEFSGFGSPMWSSNQLQVYVQSNSGTTSAIAVGVLIIGT